MTHVAIVGCGVVGAAIAYELSQIPNLAITVFDRQPPARAATGAALGVLMGVISQKVKGNAWNLRQVSLQRYETLIPELKTITGLDVSFNRQGILMLCFEGEDIRTWERLVATRHTQGWQLEIWDLAQVKSYCPQIINPRITGAIYSPHDRQVDPTALTLALVEAAKHNGVIFQFGVAVEELKSATQSTEPQYCRQLQTSNGSLSVDWVVVAAGLGSTPLSQSATQPIDIRPVLGQAAKVRLEEPLGDRQFQPVITGEDIHIVPLGGSDYWVGATVEFPADGLELTANPNRWEEVWQGAIALCPVLSTAKLLKTWSGLRPHPHQRPAPVIEPLAGYSNVLLATGHYRNGILLAPATAQIIREMIDVMSG